MFSSVLTLSLSLVSLIFLSSFILFSTGSCDERSDEWKVSRYVRKRYNAFAVASLLAPPHLLPLATLPTPNTSKTFKLTELLANALVGAIGGIGVLVKLVVRLAENNQLIVSCLELAL